MNTLFEPGTTRTALLAATLVLVLSASLPALLRRIPLGVRIAIHASVLFGLTYLIQHTFASPLRPHYSPTGEGWDIWERAIEAGWWLAVANTAISIFRLFVLLEDRPREARIVSDLIAGATYVATILAIVNFSLDVPVRGLLATSGVIAIVLGLALQSSLSDVFSGIAIGLERPYAPDNLLWIEGNIEGRVVQVNWRSTWIATANDDIAVVPNSVMAKSRLINRSAPTAVRGDTATLDLDPRAPPEHCLACLEAALMCCKLPLARPKPSVTCALLKGDGARYEISFSVASSAMLAAARSEILRQAHRHLRFSGIALAVAGSSGLAPVQIPAPWEVLEQINVFGPMDADARNFLADHFVTRMLAEGEVLMREGESSDALFLLISGVVEVGRQLPDGSSHVLRRVGPGETMGAIGLLTQTAYQATATALTTVKLYALDKADIAAAVKARPKVACGLEALAERDVEALHDAGEGAQNQVSRRDLFLPKLRHFLHALST